MYIIAYCYNHVWLCMMSHMNRMLGHCSQLFMLCLTMQTPSDADEVLRLIEQARSHVCWNALLPVLRSGYLGSSWWQGFVLRDQSM